LLLLQPYRLQILAFPSPFPPTSSHCNPGRGLPLLQPYRLQILGRETPVRKQLRYWAGRRFDCVSRIFSSYRICPSCSQSDSSTPAPLPGKRNHPATFAQSHITMFGSFVAAPCLQRMKVDTVYSSLSDCAQFPAIIVTCRVSSFVGRNSQKTSVRRPPSQLKLKVHLRFYGLAVKCICICSNLSCALNIWNQVFSTMHNIPLKPRSNHPSMHARKHIFQEHDLPIHCLSRKSCEVAPSTTSNQHGTPQNSPKTPPHTRDTPPKIPQKCPF
jgi:hypothetical protein